MSTVQFDTWKNNAGTRAYAPCTAWVNFDGTGTVTIRDQQNVTSITDNATGNYTVNFAVAMDNANYICCPIGGEAEVSGPYVSSPTFADSSSVPFGYTVSGVRLKYISVNGGAHDIKNCGMAVFGGV